MSVHTFSCLDGHTCGNPVRLVSGGSLLWRALARRGWALPGRGL